MLIQSEGEALFDPGWVATGGKYLGTDTEEINFQIHKASFQMLGEARSNATSYVL